MGRTDSHPEFEEISFPIGNYCNLQRQTNNRYSLGVTEVKYRNAISSSVARIFRETREKRGLSMTQLAAKAGLSHAMISFVERELRNPTLDTMLRIARVLEVNLDDVLRQARKWAEQNG